MVLYRRVRMRNGSVGLRHVVNNNKSPKICETVMIAIVI